MVDQKAAQMDVQMVEPTVDWKAVLKEEPWAGYLAEMKAALTAVQMVRRWVDRWALQKVELRAVQLAQHWAEHSVELKAAKWAGQLVAQSDLSLVARMVEPWAKSWAGH
jgi:hypothetical protein